MGVKTLKDPRVTPKQGSEVTLVKPSHFLAALLLIGFAGVGSASADTTAPMAAMQDRFDRQMDRAIAQRVDGDVAARMQTAISPPARMAPPAVAVPRPPADPAMLAVRSE